MAAEMPVKDVLCEAMEYLSRLGSNLRTRSENLKEKKIRKDKLTNALALQRAAEKVLLICELSQKSLLNVETGVRKILEHIDASQASSSVGGKSTSSKNIERSKNKDDISKYYYFDYKSRKLKIKNKISLKHYSSMKVLANKMSKSVIDRYPVYYDCKLYRLRRKKMQLKRKDSKSEQEEPESVNSEELVFSSDRATTPEPPQSHTENAKLKTKENRRSSESRKRTSISSADKIKSPLRKKIRVIDSDSDDQDVSEKNEYSGKHNDKRNENMGYLENKSNGTNQNHETNVTDKSEEPEPMKRKINELARDRQNEDLNCDDIQISDDNVNASPSSSKDVMNDNEMNDVDDDSKKPLIKCVSLSKLLKPDVLQKDLAKASNTEKVKKVVGKRLEFDVIKKNKMLQTAKTKKEAYLAQKRKEVSRFKPKEFVINITRLPDLNTEFLIKNNLIGIINDGKAICKMNEDKSDTIIQQAKSVSECMKKSELNALSDDNPDYELIAQANEIKNSLLYESESESDIDKLGELQAESTVDKIKSALLNSDSEENEDASDNLSNKEKGTKSTKDSQNSDNNQDRSSTKSDVDNNQNKQKIEKKTDSNRSETVGDSEAAKNYLLDKSESDIGNDLPASLSNQTIPEKDLPTSNDDDAKKSLLSDSSDGKSDVPLDQRKTVTPQSKKKHYRESVQAKNELLRHSSGSETDDEQLRDTLNKIKLSLLEGLSDDEHKLGASKLDEQRRSFQHSSSSEEDIILNKVKRRKSSESHSSSTIKKSKKHKKRLIESDSDEEEKNSSNDELLSTSSSRKVRTPKKKI